MACWPIYNLNQLSFIRIDVQPTGAQPFGSLPNFSSYPFRNITQLKLTWLKLWNLGEIVKSGQNCENWAKLWNLGEKNWIKSRFVNFGQNCKIKATFVKSYEQKNPGMKSCFRWAESLVKWANRQTPSNIFWRKMVKKEASWEIWGEDKVDQIKSMWKHESAKELGIGLP